MKLWSQIVQLAIICAAIAVGAWSGVKLSDWQDPITEEEARLAAKTCEANCAKGLSSADIRTARSAGRVRGKGWIADVWSGPRRSRAFKVSGFSSDGRISARSVDAGDARRGLGEAFRRALRKRGKAPLDERYARRTTDPFDTDEARRHSHGSGGDEEESGPIIYPGDVYISGLPMVDQGDRAYCAVATAARVLQGYGIEVTMDDRRGIWYNAECLKPTKGKK